MMAAPLPLLLIGCGKMGGALLGGWHRAGLGPVWVVDPVPPSPETLALAQRHMPTLPTAPINIRAVVLATKPDQTDAVLAALAPTLTPAVPVVSIAAGRSTASLRVHLSASQPVMRAMPNLPAAVGRGITGLFTPSPLAADVSDLIESLFNAAGVTLWFKSEAELDAVTALSGSGPAYVYALIEAMATAGKKLGLTADAAMALARHTVIGAAELAHQTPNQSASQLRQAVTSKGGTTAAALAVLQGNDRALDALMTAALSTAHARARELGQ
jgi:pyrroline-5-carboxylate reductase